MSLLRSIWNDGQALTTPELQRGPDVAAYADDRVLEIFCTPGSIQKRIMPLLEETATVNPRLLIAPGVTNGTVQLQPCQVIAGTPSKPHAVTYSANLQQALASLGVSANSSGSTRIDLLYATLARTAPATIGSPPAASAYVGIGQANALTGAQQSRKIKDVSSGNITTQTINLYDIGVLTLTILPGTPGAGVPPSLPADSASAFNFSLAAITVANGYVAGGAIAQSSIAPSWSGAWLRQQRLRGPRPMGVYYGAANERPSSALQAAVRGAERWGSQEQFFAHVKMLSTTGTTPATGLVLDDTIDWRHRFVWGFWAWLGSGSNLPLESNASALNGSAPAVFAGEAAALFSGLVQVNWTGSTDNTQFSPNLFYDQTTPTNPMVALAIGSNGNLVMVRRGTVLDAVNGDALVWVLYASDQLLTSV